MSRRSIILVIVAPGLGPLFALIPCFIGFLLLFLFFFAVFFCCCIYFKVVRVRQRDAGSGRFVKRNAIIK